MASQTSRSRITFGDVVARHAISGVAITEAGHQPGISLGLHDHSAPNITFVIAGYHEERFRKRRFHCNPGSLVVKPGGVHHANTYGRLGSREIIFEFPGDIGTAPEWRQTLDEIRFIEYGVPSAQAWHVLAEMRERDTCWRMRVEELLLLLANSIVQQSHRGETGNPPWLRDLRDFLESNYLADLTLSAVTKKSGMHPVYVTRVFQRRFGCTIAQFVRRKRLDFAIKEITLTTKSLAQVAAGTGFFDQSHLSNAIRRDTLMTPGFLRRISASQRGLVFPRRTR